MMPCNCELFGASPAMTLKAVLVATTCVASLFIFNGSQNVLRLRNSAGGTSVSRVVSDDVHIHIGWDRRLIRKGDKPWKWLW